MTGPKLKLCQTWVLLRLVRICNWVTFGVTEPVFFSWFTPDEFDALRSAIYKLSWVGKESRPEASGVASLLAGRLGHLTVVTVVTTITLSLSRPG